MKTVTYYLSPASPWTYFGHPRIVEMAKRHGATLVPKPIDLGRVFPVSGGLPLSKRPPQRQAYRLHELARWREFNRVPLNIHPKHFPVPSDAAARMIIATERIAGTPKALEVAYALMRACWAEERDISDAGTLAAIAADHGLTAAALDAQAAAAQATYDANTEEATAAQVFGVPWYVVDDVPFWGQDRLEFVERALAR